MNPRSFLPALALALAACASAPARPADAQAHETPRAVEGSPPGIEAARREVAAIREAARDATEAMAGDAAAWEQARIEIPTPLVREALEAVLARHAARHRLELSQILLLPLADDGFDPPEAVHPAAPFPVRREDALLQVPLRLSLTAPQPDRLEAFVRTLGELRPIVVVRAINRGMENAEIEATAPTFRRFEATPRYALALPDPATLRGGSDPADFEAAWAALEQELEATNEALALLSEARLRHVRLQAWEDASIEASTNAEAIEIPPPSRPGEAARRRIAP